MIVVSGTKRSGTSMWMQALAAAGVPVLGQRFPRNWEQTLKAANPEGFFESIWRDGIYFRTNPHPRTGLYFLPSEVEGFAVKVFIPGVVRTERAYLGRVVANLRPFREYVRSIERLLQIEAEARGRPPAPSLPPLHEWWMENFALLRDASLRRYPIQLQTYAQVLADPERYVTQLLGADTPGESIVRAAQVISPDRQTQTAPPSTTPASAAATPQLAAPSEATAFTFRGPDEGLASEYGALFDTLEAEIERHHGVSKALLADLNAANQVLWPRLATLQREVLRARQAAAREATASSD